MKVEVTLKLLMVSGRKAAVNVSNVRAQELCESRGGRPGLPVPNSPYGLCGRKATLNSSREQPYGYTLTLQYSDDGDVVVS